MSQKQINKKATTKISESADTNQEILEGSLSPEEKKIVSKVTQVVLTKFSGPIPPPHIIKGYEEACPGAADRIIKMAEGQSNHRMYLEKTVISSGIANERIGIFLSFILSTIFMCIGAYLLSTGKDIAGYGALFSPPVIIGGNFIYKKYKDKKDLKKKEFELKKNKHEIVDKK